MTAGGKIAAVVAVGGIAACVAAGTGSNHTAATGLLPQNTGVPVVSGYAPSQPDSSGRGYWQPPPASAAQQANGVATTLPKSSSTTSTATSGLSAAMKGIRTKCARREVTSATCAQDGFPYG